jgi:hypothetical protein
LDVMIFVTTFQVLAGPSGTGFLPECFERIPKTIKKDTGLALWLAVVAVARVGMAQGVVLASLGGGDGHVGPALYQALWEQNGHIVTGILEFYIINGFYHWCEDNGTSSGKAMREALVRLMHPQGGRLQGPEREARFKEVRRRTLQLNVKLVMYVAMLTALIIMT